MPVQLVRTTSSTKSCLVFVSEASEIKDELGSSSLPNPIGYLQAGEELCLLAGPKNKGVGLFDCPSEGRK